MQIQINTDNNITGSEKLIVSATTLIADELSRYSHQITKVEVHLWDEDGNKKGVNDKRCTLEALLTGKNPIAVTDLGYSPEQAVFGAIDKLKASLEKINCL